MTVKVIVAPVIGDGRVKEHLVRRKRRKHLLSCADLGHRTTMLIRGEMDREGEREVTWCLLRNSVMSSRSLTAVVTGPLSVAHTDLADYTVQMV